MNTTLHRILLAAYGSEVPTSSPPIRLSAWQTALSASCIWSTSNGCQDTQLTLPLARSTLNGNYRRTPSERG